MINTKYEDLLGIDQQTLVGKMLTVEVDDSKIICFALIPDVELGGLVEHAQLMTDFENENYLKYFVDLLVSNPDTAFQKYLQERSGLSF